MKDGDTNPPTLAPTGDDCIVAAMKPTFIVLLALGLCLPLMAADKKPLTKEESAKVIEAEIRRQLKKPKGELTKADLEKVKRLNLQGNKLTDVKGLEKLTAVKAAESPRQPQPHQGTD